MWFRRKQKPAMSRQEALAASPVRLVQGETVETQDGGALLTVPLSPRGAGRWLFRIPEGASKTFELDALGWFVWQTCDGKTSVQQIIRLFAKRYHLNLREAEVSMLKFMEMLVRKGLIGMRTK